MRNTWYRWATLALVTLFIFITVAGCGRNRENAEDSNNTQGTAKGKLTIVGSTALQPLVEEAARMFMSENPDAEITVQGGGSGTGLSQAASGAADIGMSDITAEDNPELQKANLVDNPIAIVGFAVVAHPEVGVDNLSRQQLISVFTGGTTNWNSLGGKHQKVTVVNRPKGSGTRTTFTKLALEGKEALESITQDSSGTVRKIISETPGAVGYLALSYVNDTVKTLKLDTIEPTEENIRSKKYPVWSYEHLYTKEKPTGLAQAFIAYMQSKTIQDTLVPQLGYISIGSEGGQ